MSQDKVEELEEVEQKLATAKNELETTKEAIEAAKKDLAPLERELELIEQKERGKHLEHERLLFFSDAIFAIAITLTVLPILESFQKFKDLAQGFDEFTQEAKPLLASFIFTFILVALYWRGHSKLLKYVVRADDYLILWNFLLLGSITCLPLSSTALSKSFQEFATGSVTLASKFAVLYSFNLLSVSLMLFLLWCRLIWTTDNTICKVHPELKIEWRVNYYGRRMGITAFVFLVCTIVALIIPILDATVAPIALRSVVLLWLATLAYNMVPTRKHLAWLYQPIKVKWFQKNAPA
jgi:uncharacterized membrane protein